MSTVTVHVGFVPLLDAALLVAAARRGFAEEEGMNLVLRREAAWSAVRDKLSAGLLDAAHYLAPATVASRLGVGTLATPLVAPAALNLNGNAVVVSPALHAAIMDALDGQATDPAATARAFGHVITRRRQAGEPRPVLAHVFPFSTHHYQLRAWLAGGGLDPEEDVQLTVVPPPAMARSLERGIVDGICVGSHWGEVAVRAGTGVALHRGIDFGRALPEKVLALRADRDRADPDIAERLVRALVRSSGWCGDPANASELASLMAAPDILDADPDMVADLLAGAPRDGRPRDPEFLRLSPDVLKPKQEHVDWILERMVEAGQVWLSSECRSQAHAAYRPDRFARAMRLD